MCHFLKLNYNSHFSHTEQDQLTGAEIKHAVMTSVSGVCKNAGYIHYYYVTISDVCKTVGYVDT